jgi:hypothetical protein
MLEQQMAQEAISARNATLLVNSAMIVRRGLAGDLIDNPHINSANY